MSYDIPCLWGSVIRKPTPSIRLCLCREAEHAPQQRDGQGRAFRIPTGFGLFLHRFPGGSVKTPGKAGGLKRGNRSKRFLLFAYGELQQLKLLHLPVFFFLVPYVEPNFPFSYSYRAYKISSRPETRSCYFTNFFKMFRYLNSAFSF